MREGTILPADISEAIVERLKKAFPGETVYTDLTPRDFERPSNMVELAGVSMDSLSYGQSGVDLLYKFKITTFSAVDEVHASHLPVLDLRSLLVMGAFAAGYVQVKNRAPKVRSMEADTSLFDCAVVTLTLALTLDRADFVGPELYELMQNLEMQVRVKKENDNG